MKKFIILSMIALCSTIMGYAGNIYVKSGSAGTGGASWEDAFGNIASAITKARSGDVIYVAAGTYTQSWGNLKAGVSIYGGFKGLDSETIETREKASALPYDFKNETVITVTGAVAVNATTSFADENSLFIDGFTFKGCVHNAPIMTLRGGVNMRNCRMIENILNLAATPPGTNNVVLFNLSKVSDTVETHASITDCLFEENINHQNQNILGMSVPRDIYGGSDNCYGIVERCTFRNNITDLTTGTNANILSVGGDLGFVSVRNCLLYNNSSAFAILMTSVNAEAVNCLVYNNKCGVNNVLLAGNMYNSLVMNNLGRFCINSNTAQVYNSVIAGNTANSIGINKVEDYKQFIVKNTAIEKSTPANGVYNAIVILPAAMDAKFVQPTTFIGKAGNVIQEAELAACDWNLQTTSPLVNGGLSEWFKASTYGAEKNKDYTNTHVRYYGDRTDINAVEADKVQLTVTVGEGGSAPISQSGYYMPGQIIELSVAVNEGYRIKEWKDEIGAVLATAAKFDYTIPATAKTLTVSFAKTDTKYNLQVTAGEGGTVKDVSGEYFADQIIELEAAPSIGYKFVNWTVGSVSVSTEATISYSMPAEATTIKANFAKKVDDAATTHKFDFEGLAVNNQWSAVNGALSITEDRSQTGTQSLCWTTLPQESNVLKISLVNSYTTAERAACYFTIYNPTAIRDGLLELKFYNSKDILVREATQSMNFIGWREFERMYGIDFEAKAAFNTVAYIVITLKNPTKEATRIYFDSVDLEGTAGVNKFATDWCFPDVNIISGNPLLQVYAYYMQDTSLPYSAPTAEELDGLATVKGRTSLLSLGGGDIEAVRKYVKALNLSRNSDGSLKGVYKRLSEQTTLTADQILEVATRVNVLGYAALSSEEDKALLNDYLDYILDQDFMFRATTLSTSDYTMVRNLRDAFMRGLKACQTDRQRNGWVNIMYWVMSYGQLYRSDYLTNQNSDIIHNFLYGFLPVAANTTDPVVAVHELKAIKRYLDRATELTPGGFDLFKPDGTGFHHSTHYPNYMYCYQGWIDTWYNMRGTVFQPEVSSYESFKKAAVSMSLLATRGKSGNFLANSMGGRNPFAGGIRLVLNKNYFSELSAVGGDLYGIDSDDELDQFADYLFNENSTDTKYDGYYAFNWSPTGVYRHANWVATMRAPTTKFWGTEIYSGQNRFGRYQSHGTLEVLYNNQSAPSGYPSGSSEPGWDWNVVPGGTTVHYTNWTEMLPSKNTTQRFDQYAISKDFCGALPFEGNGVFASDFDQQDSWAANSTNLFAPTGLAFKKSVFAFEGKLISLGSNVTATLAPANTSVTATNLFQSYKPATGPNIKGIVISQATETKDYEPNTWMITPEGTGYYIPAGNDKISVFYGTQSAPLEKAPDLSSPGSAVAAKAYINHGVTPKDKKYQFVIVPATNATDMSALATKIGVDGGELYSVNNQDATLHSLTYKPLNTTAYAFFEAKSGLTFGNVTAAGSEMLLMEKTIDAHRLAYGVCNPNLRPEVGSKGWTATPTHTSITVKGVWKLISEAQDAVVVTNDGTNTTVALVLTDGLPVHFELGDSTVGIATPSSVASSQVWAENGCIRITSDQLTDVNVYNNTGMHMATSAKAFNHAVSLPQGIYMVRLQNDKEVKTSKVVIQ